MVSVYDEISAKHVQELLKSDTVVGHDGRIELTVTGANSESNRKGNFQWKVDKSMGRDVGPLRINRCRSAVFSIVTSCSTTRLHLQLQNDTHTDTNGENKSFQAIQGHPSRARESAREKRAPKRKRRHTVARKPLAPPSRSSIGTLYLMTSLEANEMS